MAELASRSNLAARTPGGIHGEEDEARADAVLEDVTALVCTEARRDLTDDEVYDALTEVQRRTLRMIVCASARRAMANPDGMEEEHLGPYGGRQANATPDVYLTKNELRQVHRLRPGGSLATVDLTRGPLETHRRDGTTYHPTQDPAGVPGEPIVFSEPGTT